MPKKLILTTLALVFCASIFAFKFFTNSASAELAEIDPADWRLETFFLDTEVNEGRDPIQNLVWEPEEQEYDSKQLDTSYDRSRIVTLQINYHNENVTRDYQPNELKIRVPNPFPADELERVSVIKDEVKVSANTGSSTEYVWRYANLAQDSASFFTFYNDTTFNAGENIEGSIQITFKLTSKLFINIEDFTNTHQTFTFNTDVAATLNETATSNTSNFTFRRTIIYNWKKASWWINLTPEKITTYSGLGQNADDYTWVVWRYGIGSYRMSITKKFEKDYYGVSEYWNTKELFADDVVIMPKKNDVFETTITDLGGGEYLIKANYNSGYFVTGYPKDKYNSELGTNIVTESISLYGTYLTEDTSELLSTGTKSVNLDDYQFDPQSGKLTVGKSYTIHPTPNAQKLRHEYEEASFKVSAVNHDFSGEPYDIRLGDDVMFYEDTQTGEINRLADDYYYFRYISDIGITDFDGDTVNCADYDAAIYVRLRGQQEYVKQGNLTSCARYKRYNFPSGTVSWYIELKNLDRPLRLFSVSGYQEVKLPEDAPDYGKIHNFSRLEITKNGNRVNAKTLDDYADDSLKSYISDFDIATYGSYQHRESDSQEWTYFIMPDIYRDYSSTIIANTPEYNPTDDAFHGVAQFQSDMEDLNQQYYGQSWKYAADQFDTRYLHTKAELAVLAPEGAIIDSTEEEIAQSFKNRYSYDIFGSFKDKNANPLFSSRADYESFIRNHTTVTITKNWRNTGRYYIRIVIDFSERPFTTFNLATGEYSSSPASMANYAIKYSIPYDTYREKGLNYKFISIVSDDQEELGPDGLRYAPGDGVRNYSDGLSDLDDDGRTDDNVWTGTKTVTLLPAASSHQDIQTSIYSADSNEYVLDDTIIEPGSEYTYKLRLRNSTNRITNAVIYSELEEAHEDNPHWSGGFQGVDTSFAESQLDNNGNPVKVKVFWSPRASVGKLSEDDSWQEYDESMTDKTQVKSLAFQYLDQNDEPAILPQSNYSYILVKMKAPDDGSISTYAYNKCFSEWNPIDNLSGEIQPLLTGIESNVVRAYFSEEIEAHAKKVWDDENNKYGLRPRSVIFRLYDGDELIDEGEIDVENLEDSLDFLSLHIANRANYHIEIDPIEGYNTSLDIDQNTLTFTFTSTVIPPAESEPQPDEETPEIIPETPATHDSAVAYVVFAITMLAAIHAIKRRQTRR